MLKLRPVLKTQGGNRASCTVHNESDLFGSEKTINRVHNWSP